MMIKDQWKFWSLVLALITIMLSQAVGYGKLSAEVQRGKEERAMLSTTMERLNSAILILNGSVCETNGYLKGIQNNSK